MTMNDLKQFNHGQEGTHFACEAMIKKYGSKVGCCECNKHKCNLKDYKNIKKAIK